MEAKNFFRSSTVSSSSRFISEPIQELCWYSRLRWMLRSRSACSGRSFPRLNVSGAQPQEQRRMKGTGMRRDSALSPRIMARALFTACREKAS